VSSPLCRFPRNPNVSNQARALNNKSSSSGFHPSRLGRRQSTYSMPDPIRHEFISHRCTQMNADAEQPDKIEMNIGCLFCPSNKHIRMCSILSVFIRVHHRLNKSVRQAANDFLCTSCLSRSAAGFFMVKPWQFSSLLGLTL